MEINETTDGQILVLQPKGRLDSTTSKVFEDLTLTHIEQGASQLVIDFSALDYISSAGLRVILMAAKRTKASGGGFAIGGMSEHIRDVFQVSGFLSILTVEDDVPQAVAAISA